MPLETHNMKPILRFFLPLALASLSLAPHRATAQPATVMADPTTGALFRPAASTFISGNSLLTTTGAAAAYQPLDSDLTAIAALTTTANGRSLLTSTTLTLAGLGITNGTTLDTIGAKTQNGTGNLVLATSPTLTTPNIGAATATSITGPTATNLTITGGSSGASLVLGQGVTSGSATFIPTGTINDASTSTTQLRVGKSSASSIKLQFDTSDTAYTNRLWYIENIGSLGLLNFGRSGLDVMGLSNSGNLLIGTTTDMSGSGGLKVAGAGIFGGPVGVTATGNQTGLTVSGTQANQGVLLTNTGTGGKDWHLYSTSSASGFGAGLFAIFDNTNSITAATFSPTAGGSFKVNYTTPSTNTTSGSAIFGGGIGVAGAINAGGTGNFVGDAIVTSTAQSVFRATATNNNGIAGTVHTTGNGGSLQSWLVGSNVSGASGEFVIRDSTGTSNALTITKGALAATFGGVTVLKNYTVATLPAAASYTYGEAYVSDATQAAGTSIGSAPTGGGSVVRGVYSNGSAWLLR